MVHITSVAILASAFASASAQISSTCNPMKQSGCPADPSLPPVTTVDFTQAKSLPDGWGQQGVGSITYSSAGAGLVLGKEGDNPTLVSNGYFLFGSFEVTLKAASGQGVVSSAIMLSDSLDEVDWEWVGGNPGQVQSNYFGKGDTSSYDRAAWHNVAGSTQATSHTYRIDWTPTVLTFYIDGAVVRTLNAADAQGGTRYPQTPCRIRIGIWAGGDPSNSQGTIEWAGGLTDFSKAPFTMYVQSVKVTNASPAQSYTFGDMSGNVGSIQIHGGALNVNAAAAAPSGTSASATSLSTSLSLASNVPTINPIANVTNTTSTTTKASGSSTATSSSGTSSASKPAQSGNAASQLVSVGSTGALIAAAVALFA